MVNRKKKGQRKELLCAKALEKEGYTIFFKSRTVKQGPIYVGLDFADLFDIVGAKKGEMGISWIFVSVKHKSSYRESHLSHVARFVSEYGISGTFSRMYFEVWIWNPAKWCGRGKGKKWKEAHWEKRYA